MDHQAEIQEFEVFKSEKMVTVLGFVESTTLGLLTSSYIIEQQNLHQIAQVKSVHIPPVTVFIGGKLRSPFRIYTNKEGTLMVITCEVPIDDRGLYEISSELIKWLQSKGISELVVIDGIPIKGLADERPVYVAASPQMIKKFSDIGVNNAESALIAGIGGALISESIGKKMDAISLMTPASVDVPDPASVLAIINVLNKVYKLNIEVRVLEDSVKKLHADMNKVMDQFNKIQVEKAGKAKEPSIYG